MIIKESVNINGKKFIHTYSDAGFYITRDGVLYEEAYDPAEFNREYTETDIPIETAEEQHND